MISLCIQLDMTRHALNTSPPTHFFSSVRKKRIKELFSSIKKLLLMFGFKDRKRLVWFFFNLKLFFGAENIDIFIPLMYTGFCHIFFILAQ